MSDNKKDEAIERILQGMIKAFGKKNLMRTVRETRKIIDKAKTALEHEKEEAGRP